MFKLYEATPTPVKVYRATDVGAPQLKNESGSLKILLKTCLVNGYGEGANRKEPAGWQIADETANDAIFYTDYTNGVGLKVENSGKYHVNAYMVGGERFAEYLGYSNRINNLFNYSHDYAMKNWLLVACEKGFILVLSHDTYDNSQILFFGRINGLYEDSGNMFYLNTANTVNAFIPNKLASSNIFPIVVRSEWRDGGTAPLRGVLCDLLSPFRETSVDFPDVLSKGTTASAVIITERNSTVRGTLPALFWCYHNLQGKVKEQEPIEMLDGQSYIKLNIGGDSNISKDCFVLNIQEWVL